MTLHTKMNIIGVIIFATMGSMIGAICLYYIGRLLNEEKLEKIVSGKIGKTLRLKKADVKKADHWFVTKGQKTVFLCRFVPIVRSLISIPAGMSEMKITKFLLYTFFGSLIWNTILVTAGSILGDNWNQVLKVMEAYSLIVVCLLIILVVLGIFIFYRKRLKKKV